MFYSIAKPIIPVTKPEHLRPGCALELGPAFSRVLWRGVGKTAPPFFLGQMEGGATEIMALQGTFCEVIAVRFRHRVWMSASQYFLRFAAAAKHGLKWDRNMDDYF